MDLKIKKLKQGATLPQQATPGSAGMDIRACFDGDEMLIKPLERALIPTGIALELPTSEYVALLFARSGLALREGLAMANGVGVIDSDYRGELCVPAVNLSGSNIIIKDGERIAQLLIMPVIIPKSISEADELATSKRGEGGFGSTGRG